MIISKPNEQSTLNDTQTPHGQNGKPGKPNTQHIHQKKEGVTPDKYKHDKIKSKQQRRYAEEQREEILTMKPGQRTLSIVSLNPDNFILPETRTNTTHALQRNKIHIAAIQETHIPHDLNYKHNEYRIITTAAKKRAKQKQDSLKVGQRY